MSIIDFENYILDKLNKADELSQFDIVNHYWSILREIIEYKSELKSKDVYDIFSQKNYEPPTRITVYGVSYDMEFFNKHRKEILDKNSPFNNTNVHLLIGEDVIK